MPSEVRFQITQVTKCCKVTIVKVLEIGTFVGFSVATWASAVGEDGTVTGLEKSPEFAQLATDQLERFGWNNTEILTGDAMQT